ncbi:uncharacterized protein LOC121857526 [Homarus americanus]|uniref:uncharacterized protein LOC121857526 n=1 Tax=Homarus americanus TaxID=6706 RepID=UPI001C496ADB|nr:uncharacterized protein LOC121857526 [Homarus americanus]
MKVPGLQTASLDFLVNWLSPMQPENPKDVATVYQYLLPAAPLLADLAISCEYYNRPFLTQLFLPILIAKGQLHVRAANMRQVVEYWKSVRHENAVSSVSHLKVEDEEGMQYFSFLPLLGNLTNLQVLVIGSLVGDDLLAVLGINCRHLVIFDAREDPGNLVTDVGLAYLAMCKKLRRVYFSVFADEYDSSLEQLGFTGKGVALLLSLAEIEQVQCSEYLLRDALHFLYQASYQGCTLDVHCMLLDHPQVSVRTLQILPILCPKLNVVSLRCDPGNERTVGKSLKLLPNLRMLIVTMGSVCRFQDLSLTTYGPQLTYLYITTCLLESRDVILLSRECCRLKTLVLKMYSFGFDVPNTKSIEPLFPTVEKLELLQNISVRLFKVLNTKMENLKEVHCCWATIHNLDEALRVVVEDGGWKNVELLVLPTSNTVSLEAAKMAASSIPELRRLAVTVPIPDENKLHAYVGQCLPKLTLIEYFSLLSPSTTGIFSQDIWSTSCSSALRRKK